ncbi:sensor histidine kinase [Kiloniella sp. b19]|uniref:sensor histidine kinase n=1 Tax=Kiloniella sp. GXU_MW_B19 TaxID=3141326 RepID=UPI0031D4C962
MVVKRLQFPSFRSSLSAKLLILTTLFVLLAEVFIFVPSIARFRLVYLQEKMADAHLAILALDATDDRMVSEDLEMELLKHVSADSITLKRPDQGTLVLANPEPLDVDYQVDLLEQDVFVLILDALRLLAQDESRKVRVFGPSPKNPEAFVGLVFNDGELRAEAASYAFRIILLSFVIALMTAALVFVSLHGIMVRPLRRITRNMIAFSDSPEDGRRVINPSERHDEIGVMEQELASMQEAVQVSLDHKTRLAALGTAAAKINHDLRNGLATARLISDRLTNSEDPDVREVAPALLSAIDRAVHICGQMLNFSREGEVELVKIEVDLHEMIGELSESIRLAESLSIVCQNHIPPGTLITVDLEQLYRVFENLVRNAEQAGADLVEIRCEDESDCLIVTVADNGPGIPDELRPKLFKAFKGSTRKTGSGLGLSITRELMRAHDGDIWLDVSELGGACFCLEIPRDSGRADKSREDVVFG